MDYLRGYRTFFADPNWVTKLLLTSLCLLLASFVPVVTQAMVMGWTAMAMRHAVHTNALEPLPRFDLDVDYLVTLMLSGLKQVGITLLWTLPVLALVMLFTVPLMFAATAAAMGEDPLLEMYPCVVLVLFPICLLMVLPMQVALLRVELCEDFMAGLAFREIFTFVRMMFLELVAGLVLVGLVGSLVSFLGMLALCVGLFPASVLVTYALAQCRAAIYQRYLDKGGEPWSVAATVNGAYPTTASYRDPSVFA